MAERSRYQKDRTSLLVISFVVLCVIVAVGRFLGPASFALPAGLLYAIVRSYRSLVHDYAHQEITLSDAQGPISTYLTKRFRSSGTLVLNSNALR